MNLYDNSLEELVLRSRDQSVSDYGERLMPVAIPKCLDIISSIYLDKLFLLVVMFFRFVTSAAIQKRSEFFEPFILGLTNTTVVQVGSVLQCFCFSHPSKSFL